MNLYQQIRSLRCCKIKINYADDSTSVRQRQTDTEADQDRPHQALDPVAETGKSLSDPALRQYQAQATEPDPGGDRHIQTVQSLDTLRRIGLDDNGKKRQEK